MIFHPRETFLYQIRNTSLWVSSNNIRCRSNTSQPIRQINAISHTLATRPQIRFQPIWVKICRIRRMFRRIRSTIKETKPDLLTKIIRPTQLMAFSRTTFLRDSPKLLWVILNPKNSFTLLPYPKISQSIRTKLITNRLKKSPTMVVNIPIKIRPISRITTSCMTIRTRSRIRSEYRKKLGKGLLKKHIKKSQPVNLTSMKENRISSQWIMKWLAHPALNS